MKPFGCDIPLTKTATMSTKDGSGHTLSAQACHQNFKLK